MSRKSQPTPIEALTMAQGAYTQTQFAERLTNIGYRCEQGRISGWFTSLRNGKEFNRYACAPIEALTGGLVRAEWLLPTREFVRDKRGYIIGFADGSKSHWSPPRRLKPIRGAAPGKGRRA